MELMKAAQTVSKANEDMSDTVSESDPDATGYKAQPLWKSVVKLPSDMTSKIERPLADLGVVTKTDVEVIVENYVSKRTNTLLSQILRAVESTFKDAFKRDILN